MEFMSDEEFNRVMDEFDWDAPINETQNEQKIPGSCSHLTAEASQGTPNSPLGPSTSEPVTRAKSPTEPFGPTASLDHTKRKTTNDTYVIPAEIYYNPEKCLFWDERDFDWTRPPRLSSNRQPGLYQDTIEPGASSTKGTLDSNRAAIDLTAKGRYYPNDNSPSGCLTISKTIQTGPIESESVGTDPPLPGDTRLSTPNPPGAFRPMDVHISDSCQGASSKILVQQDGDIHTDVTVSKEHLGAPEQGNDDTTNATVLKDSTKAPEQDHGTVTSVLASKDHTNAMEHGSGTTTDVTVLKRGDKAIDQDDEIMTNAPALKDHANFIEQGGGITIDVNPSNDHESIHDQGNEVITNVPVSTSCASPVKQVEGVTANMDASRTCNGGIDHDGESLTNLPALNDRMDCTKQGDGITTNVTVSEHTSVDQDHEITTFLPASTDHATPMEQGDRITAYVDVSKDFDRAIDQDAETITDALVYLGSMGSIENSNGFNSDASVLETNESTIDQAFVIGQHEFTTPGTTSPQDSAETQVIEKTSTSVSTETRLMAVAPKRPQRLFSSAVSLSSIPVRGSIKTRKSVNPVVTWQPPDSDKKSNILESPTGISQDISGSSSTGSATTTAPASANPSSLVGPSEGAGEVQSSSASNQPTRRECSAPPWANAHVAHYPPSVDVPPGANEIGKSLELPHEPQAISIIDTSTSAQSPVEAIDLTRSASTRSACQDEVALPSEFDVEHQREQSLCDETYCSIEEHAASLNIVVDLTQVSSISEASTPTIESSHTPEDIHKALLSPTTNACDVESLTEPEAVQEVISVSNTDLELPQRSLHDAQASFASVPIANGDRPFNAPEAIHEAASGADLAHITRPQGTLSKAKSMSAPEVPMATEDAVGPPKFVRRSQSSFVQFVCTPTEESIKPLQAAQVEETQPSPTAEISIPVHDHIDHLKASHEGQPVPAPDTDWITEKDIALVEAAHERSKPFTVRSEEPTEDSGAPGEKGQEVKEHRHSPDEDDSFVESNSGSVELLEPSKPQLKVLVPSPGETLTPPDSRRSSLRSRTPLKQSSQEPVSSLQQPTALTEKPGTIGSIGAKAAKRDRTTPEKTTKNKSRARSLSTANRSTRSEGKETSMHSRFSTLPTRTESLPDDDSALQIKQTEALPGGDDLSSLTQEYAKGNAVRVVAPEKASEAGLSSEYDDELAMSDLEDPRCIPFAVQLTPQRKHQVYESKYSPLVTPGRCRMETQSIDTTLSFQARKKARTGPQGRKLVGDRELGGLIMRQDTPETRANRRSGATEVNKLVKKAMDNIENSSGKATEDATEDAPVAAVAKTGREKTSARKRGRNKSLDVTSERRVIGKKPRRSGRLSDGVDTTEDVKVAETDKPRRSGRLVDGTMKGSQKLDAVDTQDVEGV